MPIRIRAKKAGFRRCGIAHPAEWVEYPDDAFTQEQIDTLLREPMLQVATPEVGFGSEIAYLNRFGAPAGIDGLNLVVEPPGEWTPPPADAPEEASQIVQEKVAPVEIAESTSPPEDAPEPEADPEPATQPDVPDLEPKKTGRPKSAKKDG